MDSIGWLAFNALVLQDTIYSISKTLKFSNGDQPGVAAIFIGVTSWIIWSQVFFNKYICPTTYARSAYIVVVQYRNFFQYIKHQLEIHTLLSPTQGFYIIMHLYSILPNYCILITFCWIVLTGVVHFIISYKFQYGKSLFLSSEEAGSPYTWYIRNCRKSDP